MGQKILPVYNNVNDLSAALNLNNDIFRESIDLCNEGISSLSLYSDTVGISVKALDSSFESLETHTKGTKANIDAIYASIVGLNQHNIAQNDDEKATDNLRGARGTLLAMEMLLAMATTFSTGLAIANLLVQKKSAASAVTTSIKISKASKKKAKAYTVEATTGFAATASKPLIGPIILGVALAALAGGIALFRGLMPAMATGGVVSAPTVALVGEGRYPEAVVPLGDSPQFSSMKSDIASAVVQAMSAVMGNQSKRSNNSGPSEIVLNIDGSRLARFMLPSLSSEQKRIGYNVMVREA
jgi:hypothetical protein